MTSVILSGSPANVIEKQFLLKQIENEINAGFVFVAAARNAYKHLLPAEGDAAISEALTAHQQALRRISESGAVQVQGVAHQLSELREAIDWLRESHLAKTHG